MSKKIPSFYNFLADIWNNSVQTGSCSRFNYEHSCWLVVGTMTYKKLPRYMKDEYARGRVLIYPRFPEYSHQDMDYEED